MAPAAPSSCCRAGRQGSDGAGTPGTPCPPCCAHRVPEGSAGPGSEWPWGRQGLGELSGIVVLLAFPFRISTFLRNCILSVAAKQQMFLLIKSQRRLPEAVQIGFCWNLWQPLGSLNSWEKRGKSALSYSQVSLLLY